jgi:hypothetical protein
MKKLVAVTVLAVVAIASPAQSAHIIVPAPQGAGDLENVLLDTDLIPGVNVARGTLNQNRDQRIVFTLAGNEVLVSSPQGQAEIDSADGTFTTLNFVTEGDFAFSSVSFNIDATTDGFANFIFDTTAGIETLSNISLDGAGANRFNFTTTGGALITGVTLNALGTTSFSSVSQVRLGAASVGAVPEPATWAMMLGGFGLVGGAMRSARRRKAKVTYATA